MSATILYHMLGIRGSKFVKQKIVPGGIEFYIECHEPVCPCCGSANVWRKGGKTRTFRSLPIGSKKTTIVIDVPRILCHDCKAWKQVHLTFAKEHKRYTRFLAAHVLDLLLSMTCQDVAEHLGMSWDTVRDIEKERLQRNFAKPPLKEVTHIAIDEIAIQKGHQYLTIVMDLKAGRVIFVGDGKDGKTLIPFGKRLRRSRAKTIAVCSDLTVAHTLKDELHELWEADTQEDAMRLLSEWITDAEWSQIPEMLAFAKTLRNHWEKT